MGLDVFIQALLGLVVLNESSSFEATEGSVHGGLVGYVGGDLPFSECFNDPLARILGR